MRITIAIPTIAGRTKYLESCLRTCIAQDDSDLEILVSDNSDGAARDTTLAFGDKRIRYVSPPDYLPMSAHWDYVLQNVTGESICIIGDDDGLMPSCLRRVREITKEAGNVPIAQSLGCFYWDDFVIENRRNTVKFYHDATGLIEYRDSKSFLSAVCSGKQSYNDGPMVYHGFIPASLLKSRIDRPFFRRSMPDVYSAMAIAARTSTYLHVGESLTLPGQGARGNGAAFTRKTKDSVQFELDMIEHYPPRFRVRATPMHVVDSLLEAAEAYGVKDVASNIDYTRHLLVSLNAVRGIPGVGAKARESIELLRVAKSKGVIGRVITRGPGLLIDRRRNRAHPGDSAHSLQSTISAGMTVALGKDVCKIHDATVALHNWMQNRLQVKETISGH